MAWHSTITTITTAAITTKTTFIFYLLYYLISAPPSSLLLVNGQLESDGCLKLTSSEACRAFSQYYVGLTDNLKSTYPFLSDVSDVTSFDNALYNHVGSSSILQQLGCSNNDTQNNDDETTTTTTSYPRYSLSRLCASLVHNAAGSLSCNYGRSITPVPLCQTTCNDWVDSLENMTTYNSDSSSSSSDASLFTCPSSIYGSLLLECSTWPAYTGTNGSCVLGSDNEPDNCGFYDDQTHACEYCESHSDDSCCQNVSCSNSTLSAGAIAGIVVGSLAGAAILLFALFYFFCWRRRDNTRFLPIATAANNTKANGHHREDDEAREHLVNNNYANGAGSIGVSTTTAAGTIYSTAVEMEEKTQLPSPNPVEMAELFCEAVHSYPPQVEDELDIREGDIVYLIFQLDDGWGYGLNVSTSQTGVFPLVCVVRAREELLEQLLLMPSDQEQFANDKTLAEEEQQEILPSSTGGSVIVPPRQRSPSPLPAHLENSPTSASSHSLLQWRMQQFRDDVRRSISVNSLKRISRQPRPAPPPVNIHHHNTVPSKRVTDALSPQQQLFSAPIPSSERMAPPPPVPRHMNEEHEMHHPNPPSL